MLLYWFRSPRAKRRRWDFTAKLVMHVVSASIAIVWKSGYVLVLPQSTIHLHEPSWGWTVRWTIQWECIVQFGDLQRQSLPRTSSCGGGFKITLWHHSACFCSRFLKPHWLWNAWTMCRCASVFVKKKKTQTFCLPVIRFMDNANRHLTIKEVKTYYYSIIIIVLFTHTLPSM